MKTIRCRPYFPVIFAVVLVLGVLLGLSLNLGRDSQRQERQFFSIGFNQFNKVNEIISYIYESYVDSINRDQLTDDAIVSLLQTLDPHSSYIPAADFRQLNDPLMGSFEGIGIEFNMITDTVVVINPIAGGPSEKIGLMAGDRIIKVEGETIAGINKASGEVVRLLKGPKGTTVTVSILRRGVDDLIDFTITRDEIPSHSLDVAYMIDSETGYIKLGKFSATTHQEFLSALERLKSEGMEQMILDLRGNGGGFLEASIHLADEFLSPGSLIVYTEGHRRPTMHFHARRAGGFETQPLIVLIDEWSASASEIIAGAVQDHDRGIIIGRRSFGKGLVQEQVQLGDGSALRLTVARYYTPSGRSIQKPYDNGSEEYYADFLRRYLEGELEYQDSIRNIDTLRFKTASGRIVYGGGGISPDIFVPIQTADQSDYFIQIANRGLIYRFAFDYTDLNRTRLAGYENAQNFIANFQIDANITRQLIAFSERNGVPFNTREFNAARKSIETQLKAFIGRNLFGNDAFYPVLNMNDPAVTRALEVFQSNDMTTYLRPPVGN